MENTAVKTPLGVISGTKRQDITTYFGVPFAKPPVGELRFRRPQPVDAWEGDFLADHCAKNPMQYNATLGFDSFSEDCLYLNIWVPEHEAGEKLPVMVWIPGGAYEIGGANSNINGDPSYNCSFIARDGRCICVSVTYRLNVFGFLNFGRYSSRFDDNLGMWDLIEALKWIHANIASFGGAADNVTLFGESAGAGAISALMVCDEASPYYHKAIMESNCLECYHDEALEDIMAREFLRLAGVAEDRAEDLLDLPYDRLFEVVNQLDMFMCAKYFLRCTYAPVIDGKLLREYPTIDAFEHLDKPVLIGSNHDEGRYQTAVYLVTEENSCALRDIMLQNIPRERREKLAATYAFPDRHAMSDVFTDVLYAFPKIRFAENVSRGSDQKVYVYRYDHVTPYQKKENLMACHISELFPLFNCTQAAYGPWVAGDEEALRKIGVRMRRYWTAFAKTGRPEADGQVEWKAYDEKDRWTLVIDTEDSLLSDPEKVIRDRYEGIKSVLF